MKLGLIALLFISTSVLADPFWLSAPITGTVVPTDCEWQFGANTPVKKPLHLKANGEKLCFFDLVGLQGPISATVKTCNGFWCSTTLPCTAVAGAPNAPTGVTIVPTLPQ